MSTPIALCCDGNYARPLAVTVASIAASHDDEIDVFVLQSGVTAEDRSRIEAVAGPLDLHWLEIDDEELNDALLPPHLPPAALYRLFLPTALPKDVSRYLYLDTDLLVTAPLHDLLAASIDDAVLGAVRDPWIGYFGTPNGPPHVELGVPARSHYFNSGVLLVDRERWSERDVSGRALDLLRRLRLPYADQCALNTVLHGEWFALDPRWNVQPAHPRAKCYFDSAAEAGAIVDAVSDPGVIHFVGPKPWTPGHDAQPNADSWFATLDRTPYAGWRPPAHPSSSPIQQRAKRVRVRAAGALRRASSSLDADKRRRRTLEQTVEAWTGGVVQDGPFRGLRLPTSEVNQRVPRLIGTFEAEIHDVLESISEHDAIVLVDDPYYAFGMAHRHHGVQVTFAGAQDVPSTSFTSWLDANPDIDPGRIIEFSNDHAAAPSEPDLVVLAAGSGDSLIARVRDLCAGSAPRQVVVRVDEMLHPGITGQVHNALKDRYETQLRRQGERAPSTDPLVMRLDEPSRWAAVDERTRWPKAWVVGQHRTRT